MDWNNKKDQSNEKSNINKKTSFEQILKEQFNIENPNNKNTINKKESQTKLIKRNASNEFINTNKNLHNNANLNIKGNNNRKLTEFDIENFSVTNSVYVSENNILPNEEYKLENLNSFNFAAANENEDKFNFKNVNVNNILNGENIEKNLAIEEKAAVNFKFNNFNLNEEENNNCIKELNDKNKSSSDKIKSSSKEFERNLKNNQNNNTINNLNLNLKSPENKTFNNENFNNDNNDKKSNNNTNNNLNNNPNHENSEDNNTQTKALKSEFEKKLQSFLKPENTQLMNSSKWEDRKKGFMALNELINISKIYNLEELKKNFEDLIFYMKLILKNFKENNFNILREAFLCYADLAKILSLEKIFDKKICLNILKEIWEKLLDTKLKENLINLLFTFMEYFSPIYVITSLIKLLEKTKSVNLLKEYSVIFEKSIDEFGISNIPVKEIVNFCKILANNSSAQVRTAAISLLGALYRFVGKDLKALLSKDVKESTFKVIEGELDKVSVLHGAELTLGMQGKRVIKDIELLEQQQKSGLNAFSANNNNNNNKNKNADKNFNFLCLISAQDISKKISKDSKIVKDINAGKWLEKKEAFESLQKLLAEVSNKIEPNGIQEFMLTTLKPKFADGNKQLVRLAIQAFTKLIFALGAFYKAFQPSVHKNLAFALLGNLSDKMLLVREDVLACLETWIEFGGLESLLPYVLEHLGKNENFEVRNDLLRFLLKHMELLGGHISNGNFNGNYVNYFKEFVGPIVKCLLDKVNVIRNLSEEVLAFSLNYVPLSLYYDNIKDFKPAIKNTIRNVLDKYENLNSNDNNNNINFNISVLNLNLNNSSNQIDKGANRKYSNVNRNLYDKSNLSGGHLITDYCEELNYNEDFISRNNMDHVKQTSSNENFIKDKNFNHLYNNNNNNNNNSHNNFSETNLSNLRNNFISSNINHKQNIYSATSTVLLKNNFKNNNNNDDDFDDNNNKNNNSNNIFNVNNNLQNQSNLLNSNIHLHLEALNSSSTLSNLKTKTQTSNKALKPNSKLSTKKTSKPEQQTENKLDLNNQANKAKKIQNTNLSANARVRSQSRTHALDSLSLYKQPRMPSREDSSSNFNLRTGNNFKRILPKNSVSSGNVNEKVFGSNFNLSRNSINNSYVNNFDCSHNENDNFSVSGINNNNSNNNNYNKFGSRCESESNGIMKKTRGSIGNYSKQKLANAGNMRSNNKSKLNKSDLNISKTFVINKKNNYNDDGMLAINDSFNNFNYSKNSAKNNCLNNSNLNYNSIGENVNDLNVNLLSTIKTNKINNNKSNIANRNSIQVTKISNKNTNNNFNHSSESRNNAFVSKLGKYEQNTKNLNRENSQKQRLGSTHSNKNLLNLSKISQHHNNVINYYNYNNNTNNNNNNNNKEAINSLILKTAEKEEYVNSHTIQNESEYENENSKNKFFRNNKINKENFSSIENNQNCNNNNNYSKIKLRNSVNISNSNKKNNLSKTNNHNVNLNMNTISTMTPSRTNTKSALSANKQLLLEENNNNNLLRNSATITNNFFENNLKNNQNNYNNSEIFNSSFNLKFRKEKRNEIEKREKINLDSSPTEEYIAKLKDYLRLIFQEQIYSELISEDLNVNLNILYHIMHKISESLKNFENFSSQVDFDLLSKQTDLNLMFENLDVFLKWIFWRFSATQNPVITKGVLEFFGFLVEKFSLLNLENKTTINSGKNNIHDISLNETEAGILLYYLLNNQCIANSKTKNTVKHLIFKFCSCLIPLSKAYAIITSFITSPNKNQKLSCEALEIFTKLTQDFGFSELNEKEIKILIRFSMLNNIEGVLKTKINSLLTNIGLEATEVFLAVASEFDINTNKYLLEKFKPENNKKLKRLSNPTAASGNAKKDLKKSFNYVATVSDNEADFHNISSSNGFDAGKILMNKNRVYNSKFKNSSKDEKRVLNRTEIHNQSQSDFSVDVSGVANSNFNNNNNNNICFNDSSSFFNNVNSSNLIAKSNNVNLKSGFFNSGFNNNVEKKGRTKNKGNCNSNLKYRSSDNSNYLANKKLTETQNSVLQNENLNFNNNAKINDINFLNGNNLNEMNYNNEVLRTDFNEKEKDKTNFYMQGSFTFKQDYNNNNNNKNNNYLFESVKLIQNKTSILIENKEPTSSEFSNCTPKKTTFSTNSSNHFNHNLNSNFDNINNHTINNKNNSNQNNPKNEINLNNKINKNINTTNKNNNINLLLSSSELDFSDSIKLKNEEASKTFVSGFSGLSPAEDSLGAKPPAQSTSLYKLMDEADSGILSILDKMNVDFYNETLEALVQLLDIIANKYEESKISLIANLDNIFEKFLNMLNSIFKEIDIYTIEKLSSEKINVTKYLLTTVYRIASKKELINYALLIKIAELFEILLRGLLIENSENSANNQQALIIGFSVNSIILKLLENFDYTKNFEILFDLIMKYRNYEAKAKIVSLSMKCLLKLVQILEKIINELKLDQIFYKVHLLVSQIESEAPDLITSNKLDLIIIKFLKNVVFEFAKIKNDAIITEYIKFVEKIDVKDKFIKQWIKEFMNSNSARNVIKIDDNKEKKFNDKNDKIYNQNIGNVKSINENLKLKVIDENKFNNCDSNYKDAAAHINFGDACFIQKEINISKGINNLRIENNFGKNENLNINNKYKDINQLKDVENKKSTYSKHTQNDYADLPNIGNAKNTTYLSSNEILDKNNEIKNMNNSHFNYISAIPQTTFTYKNPYKEQSPANMIYNLEEIPNAYKNRMNTITYLSDQEYSKQMNKSENANLNINSKNEFKASFKNESSSNVVYNYYNPKDYNQTDTIQESQDSNLKFGSGLFKAGESNNVGNISALNSGVNRIQVTKYYK